MNFQREDNRMCKGATVEVKNDNFEKAVRKWKKKVQESGLMNELREREAYEKPTVKRKRLKNLARRRWQKWLHSQQLPAKNY
jgi:small subunit ribosomal protein S21